ncbi:MAG TPA: hypothetical protein VGD31_17805 [Sphingobacteriaceae bacterium]
MQEGIIIRKSHWKVVKRSQLVGMITLSGLRLLIFRINRCPKEVQCVWQGYVNVEFELLTPESKKSAFALCLGSCKNINMGSKLNVVSGVKTFRITLFEVGENNTVVFSVERI